MLCYTTRMEGKRDLTKELLADCFRELMMKVPFSKITIRMITDRAGLIRPTFYKHFQDKYEIMEWIFAQEIIAKVDPFRFTNRRMEGVEMLLSCLEKDKAFYKKAYQIDGPNSFRNILFNYVDKCFLTAMDLNEKERSLRLPEGLTAEMNARFHTEGLTYLIEQWILTDWNISARELSDIYRFLTHVTPASTIH